MIRKAMEKDIPKLGNLLEQDLADILEKSLVLPLYAMPASATFWKLPARFIPPLYSI